MVYKKEWFEETTAYSKETQIQLIKQYVKLNRYLDYQFVENRPFLKHIIQREIDRMVEMGEVPYSLPNDLFWMEMSMSWDEIYQKFGIKGK